MGTDTVNMGGAKGAVFLLLCCSIAAATRFPSPRPTTQLQAASECTCTSCKCHCGANLYDLGQMKKTTSNYFISDVVGTQEQDVYFNLCAPLNKDAKVDPGAKQEPIASCTAMGADAVGTDSTCYISWGQQSDSCASCGRMGQQTVTELSPAGSGFNITNSGGGTCTGVPGRHTAIVAKCDHAATTTTIVSVKE